MFDTVVHSLDRLHGNAWGNTSHLYHRASVMNKNDEDHKPEGTKYQSDSDTNRWKKTVIGSGRVRQGGEHDQAIGGDGKEASGNDLGDTVLEEPRRARGVYWLDTNCSTTMVIENVSAATVINAPAMVERTIQPPGPPLKKNVRST